MAPVASVTSRSAGISLWMSDSAGFKGLSIAEIPNARPILKRFEPSALPMASLGLPSQAENAEEKSLEQRFQRQQS